jgi:hypothetical protein
MSTNDGKKSPGPPRKPALKEVKGEKGEVKGERQKAKGDSEKVKGERQKAKGESAKPKAESAKPKAESIKPQKRAMENELTPVANKAIPEILKSEIEHPKSEIEHPKSERRSPLEHLEKTNNSEKINTMEVHHHPQLDHNPKPFKEYLLEGFMIFIAVMMGFIAENIREYIDNNEQVKHLTAQLVQDLKADTVQLDHIYREEDSIQRYNDTLINLLQQPLAQADTRRIQKMVFNSHSMWLFHPSAGALGAIKNQVHLKQFSNSEIIHYFAQYERHIELIHTDQDINLQYQRTYLDPFITAHFTPANLEASFDSNAQPTPQMRNLTQADLDQLATDMVLMRLITREMIRDNLVIKSDAISLLDYVKKQYNPEE